jgi:hypothetical protein
MSDHLSTHVLIFLMMCNIFWFMRSNLLQNLFYQLQSNLFYEYKRSNLFKHMNLMIWNISLIYFMPWEIKHSKEINKGDWGTLHHCLHPHMQTPSHCLVVVHMGLHQLYPFCPGWNSQCHLHMELKNVRKIFTYPELSFVIYILWIDFIFVCKVSKT